MERLHFNIDNIPHKKMLKKRRGYYLAVVFRGQCVVVCVFRKLAMHGVEALQHPFAMHIVNLTEIDAIHIFVYKQMTL